MLKIYGDSRSGNCYKIQLVCALLGIKYEWIAVDLLKKQTRTPEFLTINPIGKVPVLQLATGQILTESNAIMHYLASDSVLIPTDKFLYTQMLQWEFYEQAMFRPNVSAIRWIKAFEPNPQPRMTEYQEKLILSQGQFSYLDNHLKNHQFLVGKNATLADIAIYAYAHVADEGGISFADDPNVKAWFTCIQALPNYVSLANEITISNAMLKKKTHAGILSQYANPELIPLEKKAVEMAIMEKYK